MKKVRIGNDIRNLEISVTRLSVPFTSWEELINLEIYAFTMSRKGQYIKPSQILKVEDKLKLYFDSKDLSIGEYDILIKFSIAYDTFSESPLDKAIDIQRVFEIVEHTAQEEDTENEFSVDLNYGRDGLSYYEIWSQYFEGSMEDMLAWHRQPALDAANLANNAASLANAKAGLANNAANLANEKAGLANDAAILANEKALYADEKGDYANAQGELAQTARENIEGDLALKIDKSSITHELGDSEELVMSQKAITDELALKINKTAVKQTTGTSTTDVMSQKAVSDKLKEVVGYYYVKLLTSKSPAVIAKTTLSSALLIDNIGDYIEVYAANPKGVGSGENISLFSGTSMNFCRGGIFNNSFYFRSNSGSGADYRIWSLPIGFDSTILHTYKLMVVDDGGVKKWELFVDGVSLGLKTYSINANIKYLGGVQSLTYDIQFNIKSLSVRAMSSDYTYTSEQLYALSLNAELLPYSTSIENKSEILSIKEVINQQIVISPKCFVSYDFSTKSFIIYMRDIYVQNKYFGIKLQLDTSRGTENDNIRYSHNWRITYGSVYEYDAVGNTMTATPTTILTTGESECVMAQTDANGEKMDFTGGFHGDETIDVTSGDFVIFYIDGMPVSENDLSESFDLRSCDNFYYIQKSSLHETGYIELNVDTMLSAATGSGVITLSAGKTFAIDGVDTTIAAIATDGYYSSSAAIISDGVIASKSVTNTWLLSKVRRIYSEHPKFATHLKKTEFKDASYITTNTLIFDDTKEIKLWYHGICCLGKGVASEGYAEDFVKMTFNGSLTTITKPAPLRSFNGYNLLNKASAKISSEIIEDGGLAIDDNEAIMFFWDRGTDSKYYRKVENFTPIVNKRMTSIMSVSYHIAE